MSAEEWKIPTPDNETIGELIAQQTDNVKKIVADQNEQQASIAEYPVIAKEEPNYSEEAKKQIEKLSIEQLKVKCQHFSKLFQVNKTNELNKSPIHSGITPNQNAYRSNNHKPYNSQARPVYIQPKTTFQPKYFTTQKPNGFYITHGSATQKPKVNTPKTPVKYIRLEPVILQKTILNDGSTVYYWHRSLPTAVEISSDTSQNNQISTSTEQPLPYNNYYDQPTPNIPYVYANMPYRYAPWSQNPYTPNTYIPAYRSVAPSTENNLSEEQTSTETTTSSTTSTTEQTSYGYGFGSFLPFYGYKHDVTATTTEPPTTTTTTSGPTTEKLKTSDLIYAQRLKFIIPVPYENLNGGSVVSARNPWDFDQYAYFPRELQPNTVNVEVPYNPTFHIIRAVAVPSSVNKRNDEINS